MRIVFTTGLNVPRVKLEKAFYIIWKIVIRKYPPYGMVNRIL